ncbi:MAG: hypothetical protein U0Y82_08520 [Thermoleophilia bacterium]
MGYPRSQTAPPMSPVVEALKADREAYAPRDPLAAHPRERKVYRLRPTQPAVEVSQRIAGMLDPQQLAAVRPGGPHAGAGGRRVGQDAVIVSALAHLVERGVPPRRSCWSPSPGGRRGR